MSPQQTDADGFTRLHAHHLDDDGTPALTSAFLRYLDHASCSSATMRQGTPPAPLTLDDALATLAEEYPSLAQAVDLCYVQGLTSRAAAQLVGVTYRIAHNRKREGVAQLSIWCNLSVEYVENYCTVLGRRAV